MTLFPSYLNGINQLLQHRNINAEVLTKGNSGQDRILMNERQSLQGDLRGQIYTLCPEPLKVSQ